MAFGEPTDKPNIYQTFSQMAEQNSSFPKELTFRHEHVPKFYYGDELSFFERKINTLL